MCLLTSLYVRSKWIFLKSVLATVLNPANPKTMSVSFFKRERTLDESRKESWLISVHAPHPPPQSIEDLIVSLQNYSHVLDATGLKSFVFRALGSDSHVFTPDSLGRLAAWPEGRDPEKGELTQCHHSHDIPKSLSLGRGCSSL